MEYEKGRDPACTWDCKLLCLTENLLAHAHSTSSHVQLIINLVKQPAIPSSNPDLVCVNGALSTRLLAIRHDGGYDCDHVSPLSTLHQLVCWSRQ